MKEGIEKITITSESRGRKSKEKRVEKELNLKINKQRNKKRS